MSNALGLIGLVVFVVGIIAVAAGVTALVVKFSPPAEVKRERAAAAAALRGEPSDN